MQADFDADDGADEEPSEQRREKKAYQRTMTANTLRNSFQDRYRSTMDASNLAVALRSLEEEEADSDSLTNRNNTNAVDERKNRPVTEEHGPGKFSNSTLSGATNSLGMQASLPRHMRNHSRDEDHEDKNDIDAENIETPPATRRSIGTRNFRSPNSSNWVGQSKIDEDEEFESRRTNRKFRSMTSQNRKALVGESILNSDNNRHGVSDGEGEANNKPISSKRLMKFKKLADLAKDGDSETEQMLHKQKHSDAQDDLGDGNFQRFASVRKTLRHKKAERNDLKSSEDRDKISPDRHSSSELRRSLERDTGLSPTRAVTETLYSKAMEPQKSEAISPEPEDTDSRLKRWQKLKDFKLEPDETPLEEDSFKDKITRKLFPSSDKYSVEKATRNSFRNDPKPPASERLQRRNQDSLARGSETRGSFRPLSSSTLTATASSRNRRGERTQSAIDPNQVREAMDRKLPGRDSVDNRSNSLLRRRGDSRSSSARTKAANKDEKDEGFEDTLSLKSDSASQENNSSNGVDSDFQRGISSNGISNKVDKSSSHASLRSSRSSLASATSVNTVRQVRLSKSPSNTSVVSNRSDNSSRSRSKMSDYSSPFRNITKSIRRGISSENNESRSPPASPLNESSQPSYRSHIHSNGTRPVSRNDSVRSVGSLSKQSSDGSLRKAPSRSASNASSSRFNILSKRPLVPVQPRAATLNSRNLTQPRSTGISVPYSSAKVKRGDSGSSKENLSRSNSGNSRTSTARVTPRSSTSGSGEKLPLSERLSGSRSAPSKTNYSTMGSLTRRTPLTISTGVTPRSSSTLPAFMRPTTASSSKVSDTSEPVRKVRVSSRTISSTPARTLIK